MLASNVLEKGRICQEQSALNTKTTKLKPIKKLKLDIQ